MKTLTDQFLEFLDKDPDQTYDTSDGNDCAFQRFLSTIGYEGCMVGCVGVWAGNSKRIMDVPREVRLFHYNNVVRWGESEQTYGELAARIRNYQSHNWGVSQPSI